MVLIAISSKLPVCIFCGPALAQLLVGAVHRAIQLHQGLFDDGLVSADAHYASGATSKRTGSTHRSSALTHATMQRPDRVRGVEQLIRVEALIISILTALSCAAGNNWNAHWTVTGVLWEAGLSRGGSLAAAALDAHHVDERVAAHPPLSAGHVQAAGGCHQPCLAPRNQRARHIPQRGAVPATKEMLDAELLCMLPSEPRWDCPGSWERHEALSCSPHMKFCCTHDHARQHTEHAWDAFLALELYNLET